MGFIFYYDDPPLPSQRRGIFLAGPSAPIVEHTPWRLAALKLLDRAHYGGSVIIPEFRVGGFRRDRFDDGMPASIPDMARSSERILDWETSCIDRCSILLAWMPFRLEASVSPDSLPGFSTRAEVMRAITSRRPRLVLGMPSGALAGGQIRYHAHKAGYRIWTSLEETVGEALRLDRLDCNSSPDDLPIPRS